MKAVHALRPADRVGVAIFVRPIETGQVKTRLAATLGADTTATLYRAFIDDTVALVRALAPAAAWLWVAGDPEHPSLSDVAPDWPRRAQPAGDLGERQRVALSALLEQHPAALAIGSDAPSLPVAALAQTCDMLARAPLVFTPAADGGYCLIGVRGPLAPSLLSDVRWSSRHTLSDVRHNAAGLGLEPALTCPHYDVDDGRDLALLRLHLRLDPTAAPRTASVLRGLRGAERPPSDRCAELPGPSRV